MADSSLGKWLRVSTAARRSCALALSMALVWRVEVGLLTVGYVSGLESYEVASARLMSMPRVCASLRTWPSIGSTADVGGYSVR